MIDENFGKCFAILSTNNITSIPFLCSAFLNGGNQWYFNEQDNANCLNNYFASISTVNGEHTQLPPFTKLTNNSLSHINCTKHKI